MPIPTTMQRSELTTPARVRARRDYLIICGWEREDGTVDVERVRVTGRAVDLDGWYRIRHAGDRTARILTQGSSLYEAPNDTEE